jgi:ketosteroid isomerase-like protein
LEGLAKVAVVRPRQSARGAAASESDLELPIAHLVKVRDGKATAFSTYVSETAAREAAGLPE